MRRLWILALVSMVLCGLLLLQSCGRESPGPSGRPEGPLPEGLLVPFSCFDGPSEVIDIEAVASLRPIQDIALLTEDSWAPTSLLDFAPLPAGYLFLDSGAGEVTVFDQDLAVEAHWGRIGRAPSEFLAPHSIAYNPFTDTVWVLHSRRISELTLQGEPLRSFTISRGGGDLAVEDSIRFLIAYPASKLLPYDPQPLLLGFDGATEDSDTLFGLAKKDMNPPRALLPIIDTRVAVDGGYTFLMYPSSGLIDVFDKDGLVSTIHTCMPEQVIESYKQQTEDLEEDRTRYQYPFDMIGDVTMIGDTLFVLVPVPNREGIFHIDRYHIDGTYAGSLLLDEKIAPSRPSRFVNDSMFMQFNAAGYIDVYRWKR